jgi:hypothetical protein
MVFVAPFTRGRHASLLFGPPLFGTLGTARAERGALRLGRRCL